MSTMMRRMTLAATVFAIPAIAMAQTATPRATTPGTPVVTQSGVTAAPAGRRASQLIGANVINEENRNVGEVHDLMIDPAGGPTIVVLSVGGFLGMGERWVAMPISELRWNTDRERWMLPGATVDSLKARPAFTYPERS